MTMAAVVSCAVGVRVTVVVELGTVAAYEYVPVAKVGLRVPLEIVRFERFAFEDAV
jgi:hypothetical protein